MSEVKTTKIVGSNLFGEAREYTFNLIDALTGTKLYHKHMPVIVQALPFLKQLFQGSDGKESNIGEIAELTFVLPNLISWDCLEELAKEMLGGHVAMISGKKHTADDTGFHDGTAGDPLEIYTALYCALSANYPKYIAPLLKALEEKEEGENDSSQPPAETTGQA